MGLFFKRIHLGARKNGMLRTSPTQSDREGRAVRVPGSGPNSDDNVSYKCAHGKRSSCAKLRCPCGCHRVAALQ